MSERDDLRELFRHIHDWLAAWMAGLADDEWAWLPTTEPALGLRWRLDHLAGTLADPRNSRWLGVDLPAAAADCARTGAAALLAVGNAWHDWGSCLDRTDLDAPIGPAAGRFGDASRRSFVLHVADEVVHHTAEAALLRDLYAAIRPG